MTPFVKTLDLADEQVTMQLGAAFVPYFAPGFLMYLEGDLGAGKSTLTRGLLRGLGIKGALRSPSYALVEQYEVDILPQGAVYHFDFYRLEHSPFAWQQSGFDEFLYAPHAAIIEWSSYAQGLPPPSVMINLSLKNSHRQAVCHVLDKKLCSVNLFNGFNDAT